MVEKILEDQEQEEEVLLTEEKEVLDQMIKMLDMEDLEEEELLFE